MNKFDEKVLNILPNLKRYAFSLTNSYAEGEDLLHDSLEKIFANKSNWQGNNIKGWSMTIMTNINKNKWRKTKNMGYQIPLDDVDLPREIPAQDPLEKDKIEHAIAQLSNKNREVLMLVVIEGYQYGEVATMLKIPMGTVMSRLSRARSQLTKVLNGQNIIAFKGAKND